jgi:hypothetical protein
VSRRSADHYIKEVVVDATGATTAAYYAVYHYPHSAESVRAFPVTQQTFSYATTRNATVVVRVKVPAAVEVIKEG